MGKVTGGQPMTLSHLLQCVIPNHDLRLMRKVCCQNLVKVLLIGSLILMARFKNQRICQRDYRIFYLMVGLVLRLVWQLIFQHIISVKWLMLVFILLRTQKQRLMTCVNLFKRLTLQLKQRLLRRANKFLICTVLVMVLLSSVLYTVWKMVISSFTHCLTKHQALKC